ncbi:PIN domain-containing protein [Paenibacillus terrae]|uniref:PIN domain-containing protein n=1 Tax=Paenibacillus terrae TaxID=159743 RepID=UPI0011EB47E3|nr:PIN domain-containing protein [Paenibacillus terrae]
MKYLLLDTNIYFDFIIHRTKENPPESFRYFEDLIVWGDTQLIVPEIVVVEANRRIEQMVDSIGGNLKNISKELNKSYWFSFDTTGNQDFNSEISNINTNLNEFLNTFNKRKSAYIRVAKTKINSIFDRSFLIKTDDELLNNTMKRKMFKQCPFHRDSESYGDALILETLLNIKKYLQIEPEDKIYFISRNHRDFSDSKDKDRLHNDILIEIERQNLQENIIYSRYFYKTLKQDFNLDYIDATQVQEDHYQKIIDANEDRF